MMVIGKIQILMLLLNISCVTTTPSSSGGPSYHNKIEWEHTAGGKVMLTPVFYFLNELDKASQCVLCGMKKGFYCLGCFNKNKPNQVMPLCHVKQWSSLTKNNIRHE